MAIEATIAVKMSGGTIALSRVTNEEPIVARVVVSQFGSPSAAGPICRATTEQDAEAEAEQDLDREGRQAQPAVRCVVVSDTELPEGGGGGGR